MTEKQTRSLDSIVKYIFIFAEFSLVGWIYEVTLAFIYGWGFVNRGFLYGPFLPIYGFGGVILTFALGKLIKKDIRLGSIKVTPIFVFLGIVVITTTLELISGLIIDRFLSERLWDYTHYNFNFMGIIALNPSVRFGLGGMFLLYILLPLFQFFTDKISVQKKNVISIVLLAYFLFDFIVSVLK